LQGCGATADHPLQTADATRPESGLLDKTRQHPGRAEQMGRSDVILQALESALPPIVEEFMPVYSTPGLAVGVVHDGRIVFAKGYGVRSVLTNEALTTRSVFHMASNAKPFVATAVYQLVEQGKVDLDASVATYLPYFSLADSRAASITIRQLLSHSSGLSDVDDYEWEKPQHDDGALERYVRSLNDHTLLYAPGDNSRYSNIAFNVLGDVIAKVSGRTFERYIEEYIFSPLGMDDSTFFKNEVPVSLEITSHVEGLGTVEASEIYPYNRVHAPSSTLNSNVLDMCRWMLANLNRGELGGVRILDDSSYDSIWTRQTPEGAPMNVGLSWFLGSASNAFMVSHTGSDLGFRSILRLLPDLRSGVVVMANSSTSYPAIEAVSLAALGVLLEREFLIGPAKTPIRMALGAKLAEDGIEAASEAYRIWFETSHDAYDFSEIELIILAKQLGKVNRTDDAIALLKLNLESYEVPTLTLEVISALYLDTDRNEEAEHCYERLRELAKEHPSAANTLQRLGRAR
jgi:CubicO group peptidase (beta-lactamase class C family)